MLCIREAKTSDHDAIWKIFHEIISSGETYPYPMDTSKEEALNIWIGQPTSTYIAQLDGVTVGTYYIKPNQPGLGSHVCNCGYMVTEKARGCGVGSAMCEHSQIEARRLGFQAMQFNLVAASNLDAVKLWQKMGFDIIGTLPKAFNHRRLGLIDAHVMYKRLQT